MIGNQHSHDLNAVQIVGQFLDVVEEAGRFEDDCLTGFLHDENLIVDQIVGLVGVELDCAEIVDVYFALCELHCGKCILIHDRFLLKVFGFFKFRRTSA